MLLVEHKCETICKPPKLSKSHLWYECCHNRDHLFLISRLFLLIPNSNASVRYRLTSNKARERVSSSGIDSMCTNYCRKLKLTLFKETKMKEIKFKKLNQFEDNSNNKESKQNRNEEFK